MVIGTAFTQFINRSSLTSVDGKKDPMLNTAVTTIIGSTVANSAVMANRKKGLMKWYRERASVLTGIANMVARDCNEKVYFEPLKGGNGRNKVLKAEKYYNDNSMRTMFLSQYIDCLITGEAYTFVKGVNPDSVAKEVQRWSKEKGYPLDLNTQRLLIKANIDEDALTARKIRYVASSTMENIYDHYEVLRYVQRVAMNEKHFSPKEIIHIKLLDVDGMVEGFTPLYSLLSQLGLDEFMWNNMLAVARNGGQSDKIFSAEDIDINSASFKRIERELKKYHEVQNRHGSLLLNGKMTVQELAQLDQMQFKEMGLFITGLIALQWSVPRSRIPYIVGGTNTKEDTGGNSEKAYFNNIEYMQDTFDTYYNRQLWGPVFGVIMRRYKSYKQDALVETQTQQTRLGNLGILSEQLGKVGKALKPDYIVRYVNGINEKIEEEDLMKAPEPVMEQDANPGNKKVLSSQQLSSNSDQSNRQDAKRQEQNNSASKRGTPTGSGKEEKFGGYPYVMS